MTRSASSGHHSSISTEADETETSASGDAQQQHARPSLVDALLQHPNFKMAARLYVQMNLEACADDIQISKIFGNTPRHVAFSLIATLSARQQLIESAPALTPSTLLKTMEPMGLSQHGKIEALVNRMEDQGLITRSRMREDRRFVILTPTESFLAMDDVLCAAHAKPSASLVDDPIVLRIAVGDRASTRHMRASALPMIEGGGAIFQRVPQMAPFLMADAGWLILFALMDAVWRDDPRARRFDTIARRCGVTRTHVRNVIVAAHEYGLLEETSPGLFALTSTFDAIAHIWIGECLAAFITCCRLAQSSNSVG